MTWEWSPRRGCMRDEQIRMRRRGTPCGHASERQEMRESIAAMMEVVESSCWNVRKGVAPVESYAATMHE